MGARVSHLLLSALRDPLKCLSDGIFSGQPGCVLVQCGVLPSGPTGRIKARGDPLQNINACVPSMSQLCDLNVDFDCLILLTTSLVKSTLSGFFFGL